jgi:hypothetical protein
VKIELEFWHLVMLTCSIIGAFWGLAKMILAQAQKNIDEKFAGMVVHLNRQDDNARRLERDLMEMRAELPRDYVRREDYTQAIATIMTKIDAMGLRVESYFRELMTNKGAARE